MEAMMIRSFICRQCLRTAATRIATPRIIPNATPIAFRPSRPFLRFSSDNRVANTEPPSAPPPSLPASSETLPWYLQIDPPLPPTPSHPFPERTALPSLPDNPPSLLSPLLTHLSDTLGLDSLTLLDLRSLGSPAPALGENLLMLLGTARSVKHLNTSADLLCRWLRKTQNLSPVADGLLGRNELRLRLRRRMKRARLLARAGRREEEGRERDDGITTGWVCVNVGLVGDGTDGGGEIEMVPGEDGVGGGFGADFKGTRVVVQIFTEEKRAEMDLEGLWEDRVKKRAKRAERLADRDNADEDDETVEADAEPRSDSSEDSIEYWEEGGEKTLENMPDEDARSNAL